jgi:antitoxin component of MazEF toxin-antitoxin module
MSKLRAPGWCPDAVPTLNGWEDPNTGELFISSGFTQAQINEFHGEQDEIDLLVNAKLGGADVSMLTEAPVGGKSLEEMTKIELEALGRTMGVELDRRRSKKDLLAQMNEIVE